MSENTRILELLKTKSSTKQEVFRNTKIVFQQLTTILENKVNKLSSKMSEEDEFIDLSFEQKGDFESHIMFSGDRLVFHMHSNVFDFPSSHPMHKTKYVKQDKLRSFCGVINIYNFLSDSFKYNRMNDAGYLIARVFINKDKHFFVEGDKQLGFLFNDFVNQQINSVEVNKIIEESMVYALNFDLQTPNFNDVKMVSVHQILDMNSNQKLRTAKRMGYKFSFETNND